MNQNFGLLFARPSFFEGVARSLDLGGTLQEYNSALSEDQADLLALRSDWWAVGEDFWTATREVAAEDDVELDDGGFFLVKRSAIGERLLTHGG